MIVVESWLVASLRGGEMTIKIQRLDLGARGKPGTLTIYTEHLEILVGRMKCYIPFYSKHFRNYKLPA